MMVSNRISYYPIAKRSERLLPTHFKTNIFPILPIGALFKYYPEYSATVYVYMKTSQNTAVELNSGLIGRGTAVTGHFELIDVDTQVIIEQE